MPSEFESASRENPDQTPLLTIDGSGWLEACEKLVSPNFDARPADASIKLIVVHGISLPPDDFGGGYIQQFFCNRLSASEHSYFAGICDLRVSAHCLIERSGNIIQFVSFLDRAWHAGVSRWRDQERCNDFSIGIELEGSDHRAYEPDQYLQLALLIRSLQTAYSDIKQDNLCRHSDIAPGRKTDPGPAFQWQQLLDLTRAD